MDGWLGVITVAAEGIIEFGLKADCLLLGQAVDVCD